MVRDLVWASRTLAQPLPPALVQELQLWERCLRAYRLQDWNEAQTQLDALGQLSTGKTLYRLYAERIATMRLAPIDPAWDGATNFVTK